MNRVILVEISKKEGTATMTVRRRFPGYFCEQVSLANVRRGRNSGVTGENSRARPGFAGEEV